MWVSVRGNEVNSCRIYFKYFGQTKSSSLWWKAQKSALLLVCQTKRTEGRGFQLPYLFIYNSKKHRNQTSDISHNERRRNAALPALLIAMASAQFSIQFICMSWSRMRGSFLITTLFCNNCSKNWLKRPNPFKLWWVSRVYGFCGNVTNRGNGACGESIM